MRTSNKILLGLFLTAVLLFSSLFITVRVKYANGAIVKTNQSHPWLNKHALSDSFKQVKLIGLRSVLIVPAADSAYLQTWKGNGGNVHWSYREGVLTVSGDTANGSGSTYQHVELHLPNVDSITMFNCDVSVKNIADSGRLLPQYNIHAEMSELNFDADGRRSEATYYDTIRLTADDDTKVRFGSGIQVGRLDVQLSRARFEEEGAQFGQLLIRTDHGSKISLKGKNLSKATITSTE